MAEPVERGIHGPLDIGLETLMSPARARTGSAGHGGDLLGGFFQRLRRSRGDHDIGALSGEMLGDLPAYALARAGDEGHLPVQLQIHRVLLPPVTGWAGMVHGGGQRWPPPGLAGWYIKYHTRNSELSPRGSVMVTYASGCGQAA